MAEYVRVAETGEIPAGQMKQVEVGGKSLLVVNVDGEYCAMDATCTHRGGFNVKSGQPVALPTTTPVATYPVRVTGSTVEVAPA